MQCALYSFSLQTQFLNFHQNMVFYAFLTLKVGIGKMRFIYNDTFAIMIGQLWKKEIIVEVMLSNEDNADWCPALPLLFSAKWNHYIGFYYQLIQDFFSPFQPFPYQSDTFWMEIAYNRLQLTGTEIVSHLFAFHALPFNEPLQLICHFRSSNNNQLDLKRFFKNNLKASTCIRYGKFGSSVITVDMTVNNIDDMFANFKESNFQAYLGTIQSEGNNLGYRFITQNQEKIVAMGVRVLGKDFTIERRVSKDVLLSDFWGQLCGNQSIPLMLHGVILRQLEVKLGNLEAYCHPDGFLYFTVN